MTPFESLGPVSVIMPTLNEAGHIADLIRDVVASIREAGVPGIEILVVDDDSQDGTWQIAGGLICPGAEIRVVLPVSRPGLMSVIIFAFTLAMQDFVYALTFISAAAEKPVTLGISTDLIRGDIFYWGSLMAGALIVSVPVAILYSFFLDHFVAGITGGAVK